MFVASGARSKLRGQRRERFFEDFVQSMVHEARQLGLTETELVRMVERGFDGDVD